MDFEEFEVEELDISDGEERVNTQEKNIDAQLKEFEEIKGKFQGIMDKAPEIITSQYRALKDEELKYLNRAKLLRNSI